MATGEEDIKKKSDDAWKESVEKEKKVIDSAGLEGPEVTFGLFVSGLFIEALVALGEAQNPLTKKKDLDPVHAKFIIDTLDMLKEKTKNNITKDEESSLDAILYDLRMIFVSKATKE